MAQSEFAMRRDRFTLHNGQPTWRRRIAWTVILPPLLRQHPRSLQILLAVVLPAAYGALTGYVLGVSEGTYLVLSILGVLGGIFAGFDHLGAREGAARGVLAGLIFGAAILIAHEIHGAAAEAHLPDPAILLLVATTVLGCIFGALGGYLRERLMRRSDVAAS